MSKTAYITKIAKFFPNEAVPNDEMEDYLGKIKGLKSRSKAIILRNNGIKSRYYALDKEGNFTHTNTEMTVEAIKALEDENFKLDDMELLTCGTASPDQMMPSHSCMVHGKLDIGPIDVMTATGSCNSSMWAFNYAWMSILTGKYKKTVSTGSERMSSWMMAKNFDEEAKHLDALGQNGFVAFEKEFLRWMLSDGAGAVLMQDKPNDDKLSLRIDWMEIKSYANEVETCMYAGGIKDESGDLIPWRNYEAKEWIEQSVFSLKQDARLLEKNITTLGVRFLYELLETKGFTLEELDYFMPHLSSYFFQGKIMESLKEKGLEIPEEKWFTNLKTIGNVASASGFLILEEIFNSGKLKKGQKLLLMIPESARFSFTYIHLTVV